jgi:PPP family 3-phenylpropionic acid transporter
MNVIFGGIYMDQLGGSEVLIGMLMGVSALSEMPAMHYSGAISRRWHGATPLLLACGLLAVSYLGYLVAQSPWVLIVAGMFRGLGLGLFIISTIQLVNDRAPDEWSATLQAIVTAGMWGLAPLLAGPLSGVIYDTLGITVVFAACVVTIGLAILILLFAAARGVFERAVIVETVGAGAASIDKPSS